MIQAQTYLQNELENCTNYELTDFDKNFIEKEGIEAYIFHKLASKKFRKYKMEEACSERTRHAVQLRLAKNEPIHVIFPQGGYKLWRLPSSPTVDWAEFFAIAYVLKYVASVAKGYEPGIKITFYLHTLLMEKHDNLTSEEITTYVQSFETLLAAFRSHLPANITLAILKDADLYTREDYFTQLEEGKEQIRIEYASYLQEKKEMLQRMAELNIKWNGKDDWTVLSDTEKAQKIYHAALYEQAAGTLAKVRETIKSPDKVLIFTKSSDEFIGIGSTNASIAKYWAGFGVLTQKDESYLPVILTPSQYESALKQEHTEETIDLIHLPNFKSIQIYNELNFSRPNP